jgi:GNAT superfamily N-acetyltransferase
VIRPAVPGDVPAIHRLIRELAEYERALDEVTATERQLAQALFGPAPAVNAHVAEHQGRVAGFALWFLTYSTWLGRHGLYLEDLYVTPAVRGTGLGKALLAELASICVERGYGRLEWSVLDWNSPARNFYAALGAEPVDEWIRYRLVGAPLRELAAQAGPASRPAGHQ